MISWRGLMERFNGKLEVLMTIHMEGLNDKLEWVK